MKRFDTDIPPAWNEKDPGIVVWSGYEHVDWCLTREWPWENQPGLDSIPYDNLFRYVLSVHGIVVRCIADLLSQSNLAVVCTSIYLVLQSISLFYESSNKNNEKVGRQDPKTIEENIKIRAPFYYKCTHLTMEALFFFLVNQIPNKHCNSTFNRGN